MRIARICRICHFIVSVIKFFSVIPEYERSLAIGHYNNFGFQILQFKFRRSFCANAWMETRFFQVRTRCSAADGTRSAVRKRSCSFGANALPAISQIPKTALRLLRDRHASHLSESPDRRGRNAQTRQISEKTLSCGIFPAAWQHVFPERLISGQRLFPQ